MTNMQVLLERLRAHGARLAEIPGCPPVEEARRTLEAELEERPGAGEDAPPVTIAIVGSTGVGKSTLFNTLVGEENASPASGERRAFTTAPVAATARPEVAEALFGDIPGAKHHPVPRWRDIVLTDLPDINSSNEHNRRVAERAIEEAQVLLFVTSPERTGDDAMISLVQRYRTRQWLFVLNKVDLLSGEERETLARQLHERLARNGLHFPRSRIHCVSAKDAAVGDFGRLREYLESGRLVTLREGISGMDRLGRIQIALHPGLSADLGQRAGVLSETLGEVRGRWRERFRGALLDENEPLVAYLRGRVVEHAWEWSARRTWWPVGLAIEARNRSAMLQATWLLLRQFFLGPRPFGIYRLGRLAGGAISGMAERAQMEEMLEDLAGPESRETERAVRQVLEEQDLAAAFLPPPVEEVPAAPEPEDPPREIVQVPGLATLNHQLEQLNSQVRRFFRRPAGTQDVCTSILRHTADAGRRAASRRVFGLLSLLNVPAWGFLGWVLWLLAVNWYQGTYLPGSFYIHTAILFVLYLVIVLFLWHGAIRYYANREEISPRSLSEIENPAIEPLENAIGKLQETRREHEALAEEVRRVKQELRETHHLEETLSTAME